MSDTKTITCSVCGTVNRESQVFCSHCSHNLHIKRPGARFDATASPESIVAQMAEKTNEQLLEMFKRPDDWLPKALDAASAELRQREVDATSVKIPDDKTPTVEVAAKDELQAFIQTRSYYYVPKWEVLDPSLRRLAPGTFNWAACFLTVFWMAYRKMYLYVVIWVAFLFVFYSLLEVVFSLPPSVTNSANLVMMFFFGRYGSSLYRKHVDRKIHQIKTTITPDYWTQAFRDQGGTNAWATIPLIILHLLTLYGMYFSMIEKTR